MILFCWLGWHDKSQYWFDVSIDTWVRVCFKCGKKFVWKGSPKCIKFGDLND